MSKMTEEEQQAFVRVVDRAERLLMEQDVEFDRIDIVMDLLNVHEKCVPLDFERMADAPKGDFGHDIAGIWDNYNRETGKLENCFLPRCAKGE